MGSDGSWVWYNVKQVYIVARQTTGNDSPDVSTCPDGMCASAGGVGAFRSTPGAKLEGSTEDVTPSASTPRRPTDGTPTEASASGSYNAKRIERHQNEDGRVLGCGTSLGILFKTFKGMSLAIRGVFHLGANWQRMSSKHAQFGTIYTHHTTQSRGSAEHHGIPRSWPCWKAFSVSGNEVLQSGLSWAFSPRPKEHSPSGERANEIKRRR